jgi:hypothetical protein
VTRPQRNARLKERSSLKGEDLGFLIYTGPPHQTVYSMLLNLEGGTWRLGAISASALPGA